MTDDDGIVVRSDIGTSEDKKQRTEKRSFRSKAMNASKRLRHSLKRRGKRSINRQRDAILIHDVVDRVEKEVHPLAKASLSKGVAFHKYLSTSIYNITRPEFSAARVERFSSRSDFIEKSALRMLLKKMNSYVTSLVLHWIFKILAYMHLLVRWLERSFTVICTDRKSKNQYQMPPLPEPESQVNCSSAELDDLLWKKLLYLESLVTELCDKPAEIHPEQEDVFLEALNRIICIEYDLQKTKKALRNTASKQIELNDSLEYFMETSLTVPNGCWLTPCKYFSPDK